MLTIASEGQGMDRVENRSKNRMWKWRERERGREREKERKMGEKEKENAERKNLKAGYLATSCVLGS